MRGTIWNRHGAPRNIEIQHISPNPTIAHSNSFGQADQLDSNLGHDSHLGHLDASNTSSEVPSRQSSVSNVRQSLSGYIISCLEHFANLLVLFSVKSIRGSLSHSRKKFDTKRAVLSQKIIPNNSKVTSNSGLIWQNRQNSNFDKSSPIVVVFQSFLQKKFLKSVLY